MIEILARRAAFALALHTPSLLPAQAPADSGRFVVLKGKDTVATEQFTRTPTALHGTLTIQGRQRTAQSYRAVVAPDATLPLIEVVVREGPERGPLSTQFVQRARVIFKKDSVAVDDLGRGGLVTRVFGTEPGAIPYLNLSFALLEQALRRARAADSSVPFFNLGGGQTVRGKVSPAGADSVRLEIGNIGIFLRVDRGGRILGARIPEQGVMVERR